MGDQPLLHLRARSSPPDDDAPADSAEPELLTEMTPLTDGKRFTEYELADSAAARKTVEKALAAIAKNDMKTLFSLMERKDRMIFDSEYAEGMFVQNDFAPAKIVGVTGVKRQERKFAAVDVHSDKRGKKYRFLLAPTKGDYAIVSISTP